MMKQEDMVWHKDVQLLLFMKDRQKVVILLATFIWICILDVGKLGNLLAILYLQ